jgi:hypothetical protein
VQALKWAKPATAGAVDELQISDIAGKRSKFSTTPSHDQDRAPPPRHSRYDAGIAALVGLRQHFPNAFARLNAIRRRVQLRSQCRHLWTGGAGMSKRAKTRLNILTAAVMQKYRTPSQTMMKGDYYRFVEPTAVECCEYCGCEMKTGRSSCFQCFAEHWCDVMDIGNDYRRSARMHGYIDDNRAAPPFCVSCKCEQTEEMRLTRSQNCVECAGAKVREEYREGLLREHRQRKSQEKIKSAGRS